MPEKLCNYLLICLHFVPDWAAQSGVKWFLFAFANGSAIYLYAEIKKKQQNNKLFKVASKNGSKADRKLFLVISCNFALEFNCLTIWRSIWIFFCFTKLWNFSFWLQASRKIAKCGYLFVAPDWDFTNPLYRTKVSLLKKKL